MGLVSSPERVIHGISCRLGTPWDMPGDKKDGPLSAGPQGREVLVCYLEYRGNQVAGKTPKAIALVTASVRLWTPSLP
jgi:hypothetical protein